jgi:hypothetical protein
VREFGLGASRPRHIDGNIAAYVHKNATTLICGPHHNIGGYCVRHPARETQGGDQGDDSPGTSIFAGRGSCTAPRRDNNDNLDGEGENDLLVVLLISL